MGAALTPQRRADPPKGPAAALGSGTTMACLAPPRVLGSAPRAPSPGSSHTALGRSGPTSVAAAAAGPGGAMGRKRVTWPPPAAGRPAPAARSTAAARIRAAPCAPWSLSAALALRYADTHSRVSAAGSHSPLPRQAARSSLCPREAVTSHPLARTPLLHPPAPAEHAPRRRRLAAELPEEPHQGHLAQAPTSHQLSHTPGLAWRVERFPLLPRRPHVPSTCSELSIY